MTRLFIQTTVLILSCSIMPVSADALHNATVMGVSSTGNFQTAAPVAPITLKSKFISASPEQNRTSVTSAAERSTSDSSHQLKARVTKTANNSGSQDQLEAAFDSWQRGAKKLWAVASPRCASFYDWATQKLGIGKGCVIPNLKMAGTPQPTHINVHLRTVTGGHPTWVLPDGRLKTVAAR